VKEGILLSPTVAQYPLYSKKQRRSMQSDVYSLNSPVIVYRFIYSDMII